MAVSELEIAQDIHFPPYVVAPDFEAKERPRHVSEHCSCSYDARGLRIFLNFDCPVCAPDMAVWHYIFWFG